MWHHATMVAKFVDHNNMELKQLWQWKQRERQKSNRFILANQQLCMCITLFCTFLSRSSTIPNFTRLLHGAGEHDTKLPLPFSKLWYGPFRFNPRKFCKHLHKLKLNKIHEFLKQCEFTFKVTFSVCCHSEILLPW